MNGLDWVCLAVLLLTVLPGVLHGFTREAITLGGWITAFVVAKLLALTVAPLLPHIADHDIRHMVALVLVFIVILILARLLAWMLSGAVRKVGLGASDRVLGALFGLTKGIVILVALTLLAGLTALPKTELWQTAKAHRPLEMMALFTLNWLPGKLATLIHFS